MPSGSGPGKADVFAHQFLAYTISGVTSGSIYVMAAVGFTLVYRVVRVLDLTYSAVIVVGTFVAWTVDSNLTSPLGSGGAAAVAVPATVAACIVIDVVIERVLIRRLIGRGANILVVIVATLGGFYVLQEILTHWEGPLPVSVHLPFNNVVLATVQSGRVTTSDVIVVVGTALSMAGLVIWSKRSVSGRCAEAIAQDRDAAALVGINLPRIQRACFVAVGLMAGIAAVLYNVNYTSTQYEAALPLGILGLSAAVMGGLGNVYGAIVGGLILGLVESYGTGLFGATWQSAIAYVILVALVLVRPQGIIAERATVARA